VNGPGSAEAKAAFGVPKLPWWKRPSRTPSRAVRLYVALLWLVPAGMAAIYAWPVWLGIALLLPGLAVITTASWSAAERAGAIGREKRSGRQKLRDGLLALALAPFSHLPARYVALSFAVISAAGLVSFEWRRPQRTGRDGAKPWADR
jgi:hypothetical protein